MKTRGFTLIELLLVICIIVLLMSLLIPSVGAAIRAVKVAGAERAVHTVHKAVLAYHETYHAYPPDRTPDRNMDMTSNSNYTPYRYTDGTIDGTAGVTGHTPLFNAGASDTPAFGGKFLVYFLMGPYGTGWHRPKNASDIADLRHGSLTAEWDPPEELSNILDNRPVEQGAPGSLTDSHGKPFAVFADGFSQEGSNGGVIGYIRANPRGATAADKWTLADGPFSGAMTADCCSDTNHPGDNRPTEHLAKMLGQCPYEFALISPGPNGKYGYRLTIMDFNGSPRKGSWAFLGDEDKEDGGSIDDIANYPLK